MARVKRAVNALKKRRKVMRLAKGYFGAKSKQYRAASEQVRRSLRYAYIGRKQKKRDFRRLWSGQRPLNPYAIFLKRFHCLIR